MTNLTVIAGPTAVGKGTVVRHIMSMHPEILHSVSVTTRAPRPGEVDGLDYHFVSEAEFDRMIEANELLEHATVHRSHRYGTPRKPVETALGQNKQIILEIDVQGAMQVKAAMPTANLIFLAPPSAEELIRRINQRGTETPEQIQARLQTATAEMGATVHFDHIVVNNEVAACAKEVLELMQVR